MITGGGEQQRNLLLQGLSPAGQGPECTLGRSHGPINNTWAQSGPGIDQ
jgi:hypothetical protein